MYTRSLEKALEFATNCRRESGGIVFCVRSFSGKLVKHFSAFEEEEEVCAHPLLGLTFNGRGWDPDVLLLIDVDFFTIGRDIDDLQVILMPNFKAMVGKSLHKEGPWDSIMKAKYQSFDIHFVDLVEVREEVFVF